MASAISATISAILRLNLGDTSHYGDTISGHLRVIYSEYRSCVVGYVVGECLGEYLFRPVVDVSDAGAPSGEEKKLQWINGYLKTIFGEDVREFTGGARE